MQFQDGIRGGYFSPCCLCVRSRRGEKLGDDERRYSGGISVKDVLWESLILRLWGLVYSNRLCQVYCKLWLVFYQHQMEVQVGLAMWDCGTLMSGHFINIVYVWRACSSGFCPHFIAFHYHGLVSWFVDVAHHPVCLTISLPTLRSTLMVHLPVNLGRFSSGVTTSYTSVVLKRKRRTGKWGTSSTYMHAWSSK